MASWRRVRTPGRASVKHSKNTVGRTRSTEDEAGQQHKPADVFDFPDNSDMSSMGRMSENEKDEEPYENFEPPLHSTAIYADEVELSKHCRSFIPSTPQGKEAKRSSNTSDIEESENESVKISAKKPRRKLKPISDDSESNKESNIITKGKPAEKVSTQQHGTVLAIASSELSEKPAEWGSPKTRGPLSTKSSVEKETLVTQSQPVRECLPSR